MSLPETSSGHGRGARSAFHNTRLTRGLTRGSALQEGVQGGQGSILRACQSDKHSGKAIRNYRCEGGLECPADSQSYRGLLRTSECELSRPNALETEGHSQVVKNGVASPTHSVRLLQRLALVVISPAPSSAFR